MAAAQHAALYLFYFNPLSYREQAFQEAERLKQEEIRWKKEEKEREEKQRQQQAAEEAQRIASTQLPVQLHALMEEGSGKEDGLTFVKRVRWRIVMLMLPPQQL